MRVDLKKMLFIGLEKERAAFFSSAQRLGVVDFIDLDPKRRKEVADKVPSYTRALKILRGLPVVEQVESEEFWRADEIVAKINQLHDVLEKNAEEMRMLRLEVARVEVFGDFSLEDIAYIEKEGERKVQFFCAKSQALEGLPDREELIFIGSAHGLAYFMGIHKERKEYPQMIEVKVERPLGLLKKRQAELKTENDTSEHALKECAKYGLFLRHALVEILNQHHYKVACQYPKEAIKEKVFAVEGWVPVNKQKEIAHLVQETGVYADEIAQEPGDRVPTYLENEGFSRIGEDLIKIYDIPSHEDKDPSLWVLGFFAFFFAIIVGDAGYGLIFLLLSLFLRYRYPNAKGLARRMLNLSTLLATSCIIWGILTSAFFSLPVDLNSPLRRVSLMTWLAEKKAEYHVKHRDETYQSLVQAYPASADAQKGHEFLEKASVAEGESFSYPVLGKFTDVVTVDFILLLAIVHLILSFLRYLPRNWAAAGWILFLIGAYLYFPKFLDATTMTQYFLHIPPAAAYEAGETLIFIGLSLAVVLSLIQNKWFGLLEITNVIQICGDVLSYLRLYALSLAGAMVAGTMNELALGLPLVFAGIVLVIGHLMNMALAIMGGVIHGLRLNFLEWYHYSFQGDGKLFNPLRIMKVE